MERISTDPRDLGSSGGTDTVLREPGPITGFTPVRETAVESRRLMDRALPDPAVCRAGASGVAGYATCLVNRPFRCPHALGFGYGYYCRHPQQDEIVRSTAAESCG